MNRWELAIGDLDGEWLPAEVPGTVASALRALGRWTVEDARDFDDQDVFYRTRFPRPADAKSAEGATPYVLRFGGLGPLAEVTLNGAPILSSKSMFLEHVVDVTEHLRDDNELLITFRSLNATLQGKHPRPRWRSRFAKHTHLRWYRVPLAGRIPDWCQTAPAVGPFRAVTLGPAPLLASYTLHPRLEGTTGVVEARFTFTAAVTGATLRIGTGSAPVECSGTSGRATLRIPDVARWWPHTHGTPNLHAASLEIAGDAARPLALGRIGFRSIRRTGGEGGFGLAVDEIDVFCRGAVWSTADLATLDGTPEQYRRLLQRVREAGMNMIRVVGLMAYESNAFFDACDELGILVWHEFMFASLDYPTDDPAFRAAATAEAEQFLARVHHHPSLAVLCGNSEHAQQSAMLGLPREAAKSALFDEILPDLCKRFAPDVPYVPSSPSGGALPMHVKSGISHYYGVGAYMRPLADARLSGVRFASESLAFSNIPDEDVVDRWLDGKMPFHDPKWKAGVPRNAACGWDFEDVRDHYFRELYKLDPHALRHFDPARWLALSRIVTGEVMASTFAEFRRRASTCRGALVWLLQDFRPGPGWGLLDHAGRPKAAYHYVKRALAPVAVAIVDEGLNGLELHAFNDRPEPLEGELRLTLLRHGNVIVATGARQVRLEPHSALDLAADELFEHFLDTAYAWRFGPPSYDVAAATLTANAGIVREAFHFPLGLPSQRESSLGLSARAEGFALTLKTERFAQAVTIRTPEFLPDDNYFHLMPGVERTVTLAPRDPARPPRGLSGTVEALNAHAVTRIVQ